MKDSIKILKENIDYGNKKIEKIKEMLSDKKILSIIREYMTLIGQRGLPLMLRREGFKQTEKQFLEDQVYKFECDVKSSERKLVEVENKLKLVQDISNKTEIKYLVSFKLDINAFTKAEEQIKRMIKDGVVEVLEQETT